MLIPPVPGMEFEAAGIQGAEIKRVILDDQGLIQVMCYLTLRPQEYEFKDACEFLKEDGWHEKKHY